MIRAIIFDCFGVVISDALSVMTDELYKVDPSAKEKVRDLLDTANSGQMTAQESSARMAAILGLAHDEYRGAIEKNEIKDQALLNYIGNLRKSYKTALLSNIPKDSLQQRFSDDESARYFDAVVASGEIGFAKPEARAYEITAELLGVRLDECVFTDDRQPYCDGAQAVGMQAVLYKDFPQFRTDLEALLDTSLS